MKLELINKAKNGCVASRNQIVVYCLKNCRSISKRYLWTGLDKGDLINEGVLGIYSAIKSFSPKKNCSFQTYVNIRIRTCIDEYVLSNMNIEHIPLYKLKTLRAQKNLLPRTKSLCDDMVCIEQDYDINENESSTKVLIMQIKKRLKSDKEADRKLCEYYFQEQTISEISEREFTSQFKIKSAIEKGVSRLRQEILH